MQNEAIIRLAKQKQQLEIEQQDIELQRLRMEQTLSVEELEEENSRKLAEATLTEMALRENLSNSKFDFHETLSRLSAREMEQSVSMNGSTIRLMEQKLTFIQLMKFQ